MSNPEPKLYTQILSNGISFDLIPVEAGSFMMGNNDEDAYGDETYIHEVKIDYDFHIGKYPVTQALWEVVMNGNNPSYFRGQDRPVEQVSWYNALVFCNALNEQCGYAPIYFTDVDFKQPFGKTNQGYVWPNRGHIYLKPATSGYRLPSESEYAARGGRYSASAKYAGSNFLDETGWYNENSHQETKPVGLKLPNELGIYDMSGNVREWCEDQWHQDYKNAPNNGSAWVDRYQGANRVFRGGSWVNDAQRCRVSNRNNYAPASRGYNIGFRLVLFTFPISVLC